MSMRNGARVSRRPANPLTDGPPITYRKPMPVNPEELALVRRHPNKGWARRWMRKHGLNFKLDDWEGIE